MRIRNRDDQYRRVEKLRPGKGGAAFGCQRRVPIARCLFTFENDEIETLGIPGSRHSSREIEDTIKNL